MPVILFKINVVDKKCDLQSRKLVGTGFERKYLKLILVEELF